MTDTEIKVKGMKALSKDLGLVEAERFVSLIQRDRFDYTAWRQDLFQGMSGDQISRLATEFSKKTEET
ncbi:MAG: hypothetical protein LDLANPLL_01053 [Turneriella sp.]|nr:hypothetical protein [Turneriella sp.]